MRAQPLAQLGPRAEELALRRPHADPEQLADLLMREPLDVVQHHDLAHPLGQRAQGAVEPDAQERFPARSGRLDRVVEGHLARHAIDGQAALGSPEARLLYRLAEPDLQGRTELVLSPLELLERLAKLIPPPRVHRHRYHGVLAPHALLRPRVVAIGRKERGSVEVAERSVMPAPRPPPALPPTPSAPDPARPPNSARIRWAQLLARIFEVLPLLCPACGGEMKILAFVTDPPTVETILHHLDLPHGPPPLTPARGPPQAELSFDQTPEFDQLGADPSRDFEFDQSPPKDWDV